MMQASHAWFRIALSVAVSIGTMGAVHALEAKDRTESALALTRKDGAAPSPVSIRFRDQSTVDGERIRLGDVARIIAGERNAVAELENLEVAKSAGFGLSRMIDTEILYVRYLQPYAKRFTIDYDRKNIRVTTRAAELSMDSLTRVIGDFISAQPKRPGEVRRWEIARAPQGILVPAGPHSLALSFSGARRKGKVDVNLAIRSETRVLRNIPITLNLRVEEPVLVATRKIDRDTPLDASNVSVEFRETTELNDIVLGDPRRLMGYLAKATIAPGRIITPRAVAMPPSVKRGQGAKIVYTNGGVTITADAVCRQDGMPGQIITAKNLVNQRLIRVRVTEGGWLEPVPGG